jgi:sugar phosphate isomerase/epimerase
MRFGISTHLFHGERLERGHLVEVAAHGFDAIELFATCSHFDYHDHAAIDALGEWLNDTRLRLHAIHAPTTESYLDGAWGPLFSTAWGVAEWRARAIEETQAALHVARRIETGFLVVHLGTPISYAPDRDNDPMAAARSVTELHALTKPLGLQLAVEVIPNAMSTAAALVDLLDNEDDREGLGICLDFGHAFLTGDVTEAIETAAGYLVTTHLHDNLGVTDQHLVPLEGGIDWASAMMTMQKIGYDGMLMLEVASGGDWRDVLTRAARAKTALERLYEG